MAALFRLFSEATPRRRTKITPREKVLRNIKIGDLFNAVGDHGAPLTCLATLITETTIYARTVTHQLEFKPLPPNIHETLIGLDRRNRSGGCPKLSKEEIRALAFLDDFYDAHPI